MTLNLLRWILFDELGLDAFQRRRLIVFDRKRVVTTLVGNLSGDGFLAPLGVDAYPHPVDIDSFKEFRDGGNLVTLSGHLFLTENDPEFRSKGVDHIRASLSPPLPDLRTILPATYQTPLTTRATQQQNASSNCFGSRAWKVRRKLFSDATLFLSTRDLCDHASLYATT